MKFLTITTLNKLFFCKIYMLLNHLKIFKILWYSLRLLIDLSGSWFLTSHPGSLLCRLMCLCWHDPVNLLSWWPALSAQILLLHLNPVHQVQCHNSVRIGNIKSYCCVMYSNTFNHQTVGILLYNNNVILLIFGYYHYYILYI